MSKLVFAPLLLALLGSCALNPDQATPQGPGTAHLKPLSGEGGGVQSMVENFGYLYAIQGNNLYRISPLDGSRTPIGNPSWNGSVPAFVAPVNYLTNYIPYQNGEFVPSPNPYLTVYQSGFFYYMQEPSYIPSQIGGGFFPTISSMTGNSDNIYFVGNNRLYKRNVLDGNTVQLGTGTWVGIIAMVHLKLFNLCIVENGKLYLVDENTGIYSRMGSATWISDTKLASGYNDLYLYEDGKLYSIPDLGNGQHFRLGTDDWPDVKAIAYCSGYLYVINGAYLYRVSVVDGSRTILGDPVW